jgi:L-2-hydroxycarboxylate dehydrogenase (NAD+)
MSETCLVQLDLMERFVVDVFTAIGVPPADARICADVLMAANRRGIDSHGVARLKTIYYDRIVKDRIQNPVTQVEVVRDALATAVVDGHHGMGMVVARRCMELAIAKARTYGLGMVVARNSTHYGIAAYYPLMACEAGLIGITGTNARPSVAPTFGVDNLLGTNPLVFGIPTDEAFPFTNDYATSIIQRGKVEEYAREGRHLPAGLVIDRQGGTQTDARAILEDLIHNRAALTPLGGIGEETAGYKGYGFATVVEILSAALQQGAFLRQLSGFDGERKAPHRLGHFFLAVNIECFCGLDEFKRTAGEILRTLRGSTRAPGQPRIYTCGEKEHEIWLARRTRGLPVNRAVQRELLAMRDEQRLVQHRFPFE